MASSTGAGVSSAEGGSGAACAVCEGIQSRIQTYLQEVRALQDTPVEGYDANFERMRVTTHLMRQTNDVSKETFVEMILTYWLVKLFRVVGGGS